LVERSSESPGTLSKPTRTSAFWSLFFLSFGDFVGLLVWVIVGLALFGDFVGLVVGLEVGVFEGLVLVVGLELAIFEGLVLMVGIELGIFEGPVLMVGLELVLMEGLELAVFEGLRVVAFVVEFESFPAASVSSVGMSTPVSSGRASALLPGSFVDDGAFVGDAVSAFSIA